MVARCVLLWILVVVFFSVNILEQPSTSLMAYHPRMVAYISAYANLGSNGGGGGAGAEGGDDGSDGPATAVAD